MVNCRPPPSSAVEVLGAPLVRPGKAQQFALRVGQTALASDLAKPSRQLPVMRAAIPQPPVPVGRDILQRRLAVIWHAHGTPEGDYSTVKEPLEFKLVVYRIGSGAAAGSHPTVT
jgi:hypothetical protein